MGLEFLHNHGGRRVREAPDLPEMDMDDANKDDDGEKDKVDASYEMAEDTWRPIVVDAAPIDPGETPRRFVDGCHVGHTIAWLRDAEGHPIPLMLAEVGGVCVERDGRDLRRSFAVVERVVAMIVDPFPWDEVESFAVALAGSGFRLLSTSAPKASPSSPGKQWTASYDFEAMRKKAQNRSNYEMEVLEEVALCQDFTLPTVVDGRQEPRINSDERLQKCPIVGIVKQQRKRYLHPRGWNVFYTLEPGQRTPAFLLRSPNVPTVSWYLKLHGTHGSLPNWGVVRVEISQAFFEATGRDFGYMDRLSNALLGMRCRADSYSRRPVSLAPIVRAEELLRALFAPSSLLAQQFYRLTDL